MSRKFYIVRLTKEERRELLSLVKSAKGAQARRKHADILLKADADGEGWKDEEIAKACRVHRTSVARIRRLFVEEGLEAALNRKPQKKPSRRKSLDGRGEARLIQLACGQAPEGRSRWTLHLLADRLVALRVVDSISPETVRCTLKKMHSSRI